MLANDTPIPFDFADIERSADLALKLADAKRGLLDAVELAVAEGQAVDRKPVTAAPPPWPTSVIGRRSGVSSGS